MVDLETELGEEGLGFFEGCVCVSFWLLLHDWLFA
jgi:hypothetical protein